MQSLSRRIILKQKLYETKLYEKVLKNSSQKKEKVYKTYQNLFQTIKKQIEKTLLYWKTTDTKQLPTSINKELNKTFSECKNSKVHVIPQI